VRGSMRTLSKISVLKRKRELRQFLRREAYLGFWEHAVTLLVEALCYKPGRAVAQAVSRRLPTAAARDPTRL
jgi:hypothetical protein